VEEEAVEDVRNVEDGTVRAWEVLASGLCLMMSR